MKIRLHPHFKKAYKSRIALNKKLVRQTEERTTRFKNNRKDSVLKDHALSGAKKDLRTFSITGDIRIVYIPVSNDEVIFVDIGSHNQVY